MSKITSVQECSLSKLQGKEYTFLQSEEDIQQVAVDYAGGNGNISGAVVRVGDGDYEEVWVTESSRPFDLSANYLRIL